MLQIKNENRYSGSYFYAPFSVFKLGKRKRKLDYPILIFHYGIGEWKTKGRYIQHVAVFHLSCFNLAKEKNENGYNGSYFYFWFFVWGLENRKRVLSYSFSIFYYEIQKRKDAIYTDQVSHGTELVISEYWCHDDVIKWKYFPRYWPFVRGIHRSPVNSPHKGQWRGAFMFPLICALNKRLSKQSWGWWFETLSSPLWRHCNARLNHYDVIVMGFNIGVCARITTFKFVPQLR